MNKPMNLYLLSQDYNNDYDTYDSCIVAAETEEEAREIHPGSELYAADNYWDSYSWVASPEDVTVEYIGVAKEGTEKGVIISSFNAG